MDLDAWKARLRNGDCVLLDGATGTELMRRGVDVSLPLWSARAVFQAPEVLLEIQREYAAAGADILTANTFRAHARCLARGGWAGRSLELAQAAVALARRAIAQAGAQALVAGSVAPLEDCYRPDLVPGQEALEREHDQLAQTLARAGVDLILIETMGSARELRAAAQAAKATGLPWMASMICAGASGPRPPGPGQLLSGEPLLDSARELAELGASALLVNCVPVDDVAGHLRELAQVPHMPLGAFANVGHIAADGDWSPPDTIDAPAYARAAANWRKLGASIVGGCCGTTPEHVRELRRQLGGLGARA